MKFIAATKEDKLTLSMGDTLELGNWVDASFAVHPDCKSHGGLVSTLKGGSGAMSVGSENQKLDTDSSTAAEVAGTHQHLPRIIFVVPFLAAQGHELLKKHCLSGQQELDTVGDKWQEQFQ